MAGDSDHGAGAPESHYEDSSGRGGTGRDEQLWQEMISSIPAGHRDAADCVPKEELAQSTISADKSVFATDVDVVLSMFPSTLSSDELGFESSTSKEVFGGLSADMGLGRARSRRALAAGLHTIFTMEDYSYSTSLSSDRDRNRRKLKNAEGRAVVVPLVDWRRRRSTASATSSELDLLDARQLLQGDTPHDQSRLSTVSLVQSVVGGTFGHEATDITTLPVGYELQNPDDVKLLHTGCLPWELSLPEFAHKLQEIASEATKAQRRGLASLEYTFEKRAGDLNAQLRDHSRSGGLVSTDLGAALMTPTEAQQFSYASLGKTIRESVGDCIAGEDCDPQKDMHSMLSDEAVAKLFNRLDRDGDFCLSTSAVKDFDCFGLYVHGEGSASDLTLMEDVDGDLMPDTGIVQEFSYADVCLAAKDAEKKREKIEHMVDFAAERCAMIETQTTFDFRRVLMAVEDGNGEETMGSAPKPMASGNAAEHALRRLMLKDAETPLKKRGLSGHQTLTDAEAATAVEAFAQGTNPRPSIDELQQLGNNVDIPAKSRLAVRDFVAQFRDSYSEYRDIMSGRRQERDETQTTTLLRDCLLDQAVQPVLASSDLEDLTETVESLARSSFGSTDRVAVVCRGIAPDAGPSSTSASATADADGDGYPDTRELAWCLQQLLPEVGSQLAHEYGQTSLGEGSLGRAMERDVPESKNATRAVEIRGALLDIDEGCYFECARFEAEHAQRQFVHYTLTAQSRVTDGSATEATYVFNGPDLGTLGSNLDGACYLYLPEDCQVPPTGFVAGKYNLEEKGQPFGSNSPWSSISNQWCGAAEQSTYATELAAREQAFWTHCYNYNATIHGAPGSAAASAFLGTTKAHEIAFRDDVGFSGPRSSTCSAAQCDFLSTYGNVKKLMSAEKQLRETIGRRNRSRKLMGIKDGVLARGSRVGEDSDRGITTRRSLLEERGVTTVVPIPEVLRPRRSVSSTRTKMLRRRRGGRLGRWMRKRR
ncbi:unnamed protein product [Amoebophrya sp. A25]|nr:unnamed protein product [Amoebophrya sp. A25]|eukprot:GSA25T00020853001.1